MKGKETTKGGALGLFLVARTLAPGITCTSAVSGILPRWNSLFTRALQIPLCDMLKLAYISLLKLIVKSLGVLQAG